MSRASEMFCGSIQVLDGGMGSLLTAMGFDIKDDYLWSARVLADNPEAIVEAHKKFLEAGASIIETDSYQAELKNIEKHLNISSSESLKLLKSSVALAQRAVKEFKHDRHALDSYPIYIAGSIGSFGSTLHDRSEYTGHYMTSVEGIRNLLNQYYSLQATALVEAGVDCLAFETVPSLEEALVIAQVMESSNLRHIPFWISFYCKDEKHTGFGDKFCDVVQTLSKFDSVSMIGINCTSPNYVSDLLKACDSSKPFVVYPNGYVSKEDFNLSSLVPEWTSLGAKVIGGCCNVSPQHIKEISSIVRR